MSGLSPDPHTRCPELPANTIEYLRDLAARVDYFDRIALNVLADQLSDFPQAAA